jgi:phosphoesterase RecJ-like protein
MRYYEKNVWAKLKEYLDAYSRFLISSHIRPDGDAIGSALAFKRMLEGMGKDVIWVMDEDPGRMFDRFYAAEELVIHQPESNDFADRDVVVMLDAGEWKRLGNVGKLFENHPGRKVCIDHHLTSDEFAGIRIADSKSPSTTVLLYRLLNYLGLEFTLSIAEPIYLGLIVDTQNFHLPNTTEEAHRIAVECLRAGVKPYQVYEPIFGVNSFSRLRLMAEVFRTLEVFFDGKVGLMYTTLEMFERTGAQPREDEGFSDLVRTVEGVQVGIYLREDSAGTIKVSWRSKGQNDVAVSAKRFGGGGHMRAAGSVIDGTLEQVRTIILDDMEKRVAAGEIG